jgi:hypothetical protein
MFFSRRERINHSAFNWDEWRAKRNRIKLAAAFTVPCWQLSVPRKLALWSRIGVIESRKLACESVPSRIRIVPQIKKAGVDFRGVSSGHAGIGGC